MSARLENQNWKILFSFSIIKFQVQILKNKTKKNKQIFITENKEWGKKPTKEENVFQAETTQLK